MAGFRRSTNNVWIPPKGINSGAFLQIGGEETAPGAGQRFPGLLGSVVVHSNASALKDSNLAVGSLYMGVYQLVRYSAGVTTPARGSLVFWDTLANNGLNDFEVTTTATATGNFRAGVVLFTETVAAGGKYVYIQTDGLASMLYGAAPVATLGTMVFQGASAAVDLTTTTVTTIADATAGSVDTTGELKGLLGIAYETPAATTVLRVLMNPFGFYTNIG